MNELLEQEKRETKEQQLKNSIERQRDHKKKVVTKILNNFSLREQESKKAVQGNDHRKHVNRERSRPEAPGAASRAQFKEPRQEKSWNKQKHRYLANTRQNAPYETVEPITYRVDKARGSLQMQQHHGQTAATAKYANNLTEPRQQKVSMVSATADKRNQN